MSLNKKVEGHSFPQIREQPAAMTEDAPPAQAHGRRIIMTVLGAGRRSAV